MNSYTTRVKLLAQETDSEGYTTYVFQILDKDEVDKFGKYLMCTRWPNWDHRHVDNFEEGYLSFMPIIAGIDTWYNGNEMIKYKYSNIQFTKFVVKQLDTKHEFKL